MSFHTFTQLTLSEQLQRFWEIEEVSTSRTPTTEEVHCENYFQQTHSRDARGRFLLRLPFLREPQLPGSYEIARSQFLRSEQRFRKDRDLSQAYSKFIKEYLDLGHMEIVPHAELSCPDVYYISHHAILKHDKKIRVVFNASQKATSGKSLNDFLHVGPKLQTDLLTIITRWRFFKYVFTADIVKMFRQFHVSEPDINWLRILWRFNPEQQIQVYRLLTVTYGTASAPYQAIRCLRQLAQNGQE